MTYILSIGKNMATDSSFLFADPKLSGSSLSEDSESVYTLDYTAWDYQAIKQYLYTIAQRVYGDKYTNFTESDFGIVLMEFIAARGDQLSFKLDCYLNEAFISTAIHAKSVYRHAMALGYKPTPRTSACYDFTLSVTGEYEYDIRIPAGYTITCPGKNGTAMKVTLYSVDSNGSINYNNAIIIKKGELSCNNVIGLEGYLSSISQSGKNVENQYIEITEKNAMPSTLRVYVDGGEWTCVDSLYLSGKEQVYQIRINEKTGNPYIMCGDGVNGLVFPNSSIINISYRIGGGLAGNVASGYINVTKSVSVSSNGGSASGTTVPITFVNRTAGVGGCEAESPAEIKKNLPIWLRSQNRLVTLDDYTLEASKFYNDTIGRVAKARAYLRHSGCSANIIDIYMLQYGGNSELSAPSQDLIDAFLLSISEKTDCTHHICVKKGILCSLDFSIDIIAPTKLSHRKTFIENIARTSIDSFFQVSLWNFGMSVDAVAIERYISSVLRDCSVTVKISNPPDVSIAYRTYMSKHFELPSVGNVSVSVSFSQDNGIGRLL